MIDKLHYTDPIGKSPCRLVLDWTFTGYGRRHKANVKNTYSTRAIATACECVLMKSIEVVVLETRL